MQIIITFDQPLNHSLQVGDTIWYVSTSENGGYNTSDLSSIKKLGTAQELRGLSVNVPPQIIIDMGQGISAPLDFNNNSFVMFSKNNNVNLSDLIGYYAKVKFINNSKEKAELFTVASELVESSK